MNNTMICKYTLDVEYEQKVSIPKGFTFLSAAVQNRIITFYCLVNPEAEKQDITFHVVGTGWNLLGTPAMYSQYKATVQSDPYVWHILMDDPQ